jgi:hypothetical protein
MITTKSNNKFTIVTIEKYEDYQSRETKTKQQSNNKVTTKEQQNNTNKNVKNVNNVKNIYSDFSEDVKKALDGFVEMRNKIKKPLTERAMQLAIDKLKGLSNNETTQISIINESIMNNWQSFYPLKQQEKQKQTNYNNYEKREYMNLNGLYANGGK